jgi:acid phosphatase family membrane protein YuiD
MIKHMLYRHIYLVPIICGFFIQCVKVFLYSIAEKRVDAGRFVQAGGLPNLHSAVFSSLSTGVGIKYGVSSILFSVVTAFSVIIIHDTMRLKGEKGKQVDILNRILSSFEVYQMPAAANRLRVLHFRPFDVLSGAILGIIGAYLLL